MSSETAPAGVPEVAVSPVEQTLAPETETAAALLATAEASAQAPVARPRRSPHADDAGTGLPSLGRCPFTAAAGPRPTVVGTTAGAHGATAGAAITGVATGGWGNGPGAATTGRQQLGRQQPVALGRQRLGR